MRELLLATFRDSDFYANRTCKKTVLRKASLARSPPHPPSLSDRRLSTNAYVPPLMNQGSFVGMVPAKRIQQGSSLIKEMTRRSEKAPRLFRWASSWCVEWFWSEDLRSLRPCHLFILRRFTEKGTEMRDARLADAEATHHGTHVHSSAASDSSRSLSAVI